MILCYHHITEDAGDGQALISEYERGIPVADFRRQMEYVRAQMSPMSLRDMVAHLQDNEPLPDGAVCVTLDDGYVATVQHAYPVLESPGIPATIFVVAEHVENGELLPLDLIRETMKHVRELLDADQLSRVSAWAPGPVIARLREVGLSAGAQRTAAIERVMDAAKMIPHDDCRRLAAWCAENWLADSGVALATRHALASWDQLRRVRGDLIHFGAHTMTHCLLCWADEDQARRELVGSKSLIEERLDVAVEHFAYPAGSGSDDPVRQQWVSAAGFAAAVTSTDNVVRLGASLFSLPRIGVDNVQFQGLPGRFSEAVFALKMSGLVDRWWLR